MEAPLRLTITTEDILNGEPARQERDCDDKQVYVCPVTLALMRTLQNTPCPDGCGQVCVSIGTYIGIGNPYPTKKISIPEPLADWMRRWDSGEKMQQASFELTI